MTTELGIQIADALDAGIPIPTRAPVRPPGSSAYAGASMGWLYFFRLALVQVPE